jgi:hypothetical protein
MYCTAQCQLCIQYFILATSGPYQEQVAGHYAVEVPERHVVLLHLLALLLLVDAGRLVHVSQHPAHQSNR